MKTITPEEFVTKYPHLSISTSVSFGKCSYHLRHSKTAQTDWAYIVRVIAELKFDAGIERKFPQLRTDIDCVAPYYKAFKRNAERTYAGAVANAKPNKNVQKQLFKPGALYAAEKLVNACAHKATEQACKDETPFLNVIIEICASFRVTKGTIEREALLVEYIKPDGNGSFGIGEFHKYTQSFQRIAREQLTAALEMDALLYA